MFEISFNELKINYENMNGKYDYEDHDIERFANSIFNFVDNDIYKEIESIF